MKERRPVRCYRLLKKYKKELTKAQYSTIKGQIRKGDYEAAMKGLNRLIGRVGYVKDR